MKPDPRLAGQDGEFMEISKVKYAPSSMANPEPRWYGVCYVETPSMAGTAQPFRLTLFREDIAAFKEYSHDTSAFDRKDYGEHALVKPIPVTAWTYDGLRRVETIFDDEMQPHDGPTKLRAHTNGKAQRRIGTEPQQVSDSSQQEIDEMAVTKEVPKQENGTQAPPIAKLYRKLAEVMATVERIKKSATHYQNWKYATADDIYDVVRSELAKRGVWIRSDVVGEPHLEERTTKKEGINFYMRVPMIFTFCDGETGCTESVHWLAESMDTQDKNLSKLMTMGTKTFLRSQFLISTGDLAEETDSGIGTDQNAIVKRTPKTTKKTNPQTGEITEIPSMAPTIYDTLRKLSPRPAINIVQDVQNILDEMVADQVISETDSSAVKTWYTLINLATVNKRQMWHLDFNAVFVAIANEIGVDLEETDVTPDLWFAKDADGKAKRGIQDLWTLLTNLYDAKLRAATLGATGTDG